MFRCSTLSKDAEITEHLGYDKRDHVRRGSGYPRNGTRAKTVLTEIGPVEIEVPRDVNGSFEPQIVKGSDVQEGLLEPCSA